MTNSVPPMRRMGTRIKCMVISLYKYNTSKAVLCKPALYHFVKCHAYLTVVSIEVAVL